MTIDCDGNVDGAQARVPSPEVRAFCYKIAGGTCGHGFATVTYAVSPTGAVVGTEVITDVDGNVVPLPVEELDCNAFPCLCCPPPSITAEGINCAGAAVVVTAPGVVQTVPHPEAVQLVRFCPDQKEYDHTTLCDPITGAKVIVVVSYALNGVPTTVAYNLDSTPYAGVIGALVACPDQDTESDAQDWCVDGANFTQWVVKKDGQPTGVTYWSSASGAVVVDPTIAGNVIAKGACSDPERETVIVGPMQLCVDPGGGNPFTEALVVTRQVVDPATGVVVSSLTEFSIDGGVSWSVVAPAGALSQGPCGRAWEFNTFDVCVEDPVGTFTKWTARNEVAYNTDSGQLAPGGDFMEYSRDGGVSWLSNIQVGGTIRAGTCVADPTPEYQTIHVIEEGCANNVGVNRRTIWTLDTATATVTSAITDYVQANTATFTQPAGWTLGACQQASAAVEIGCITSKINAPVTFGNSQSSVDSGATYVPFTFNVGASLAPVGPAGTLRIKFDMTVPASINGPVTLHLQGDLYDGASSAIGQLYVDGALFSATDGVALIAATGQDFLLGSLAPGLHNIEYRHPVNVTAADFTSLATPTASTVTRRNIEAVKVLAPNGDITAVKLFEADGTAIALPLAAGNTFTAGACEAFPSSASAKEIDGIFSTPIQLCVENPATVYNTWHVRQRYTIDNADGSATLAATQYTSDGFSWSAVAPAGTVRPGSCPSISTGLEAGCIQSTVAAPVVFSNYQNSQDAGATWTAATFGVGVNQIAGALGSQRLRYTIVVPGIIDAPITLNVAGDLFSGVVGDSTVGQLFVDGKLHAFTDGPTMIGAAGQNFLLGPLAAGPHLIEYWHPFATVNTVAGTTLRNPTATTITQRSVEAIKVLSTAGDVTQFKLFESDGTVITFPLPVGSTFTVGLCAPFQSYVPMAEVDGFFTAPIQLCVEQPVGTFTTQYVRQRYTIDNADGTATLAATEYSTNGVAWVGALPAGTVRTGSCDSVLVLASGCLTGGGRWVSLRMPNGTVTVVDAVTGVVAPAATVLAVCPEQGYTTTVGTVAANGALTIPNVNNLVSWSVRARTAGVTLTLNAAATVLDASEMVNGSAGADHNGLGVLTDTVQIACNATGSARYEYILRV